jgi:hypothetical protein
MVKIYLTDPITFRRRTGLSDFQTPTYLDLLVMGKVRLGTKLVRDIKGELVVSGASVLLPLSLGTITHDDLIQVVAGVDRSILTINPVGGWRPDHWEVFLQ